MLRLVTIKLRLFFVTVLEPARSNQHQPADLCLPRASIKRPRMYLCHRYYENVYADFIGCFSPIL